MSVQQLISYPNPAVVVGGGLTALGTMRALGRRGIDVYLILDGSGTAHYSKYCKRSLSAIGMKYDRGILKSVLKELGRSFSRRVVVYPTSDVDTINLAELKDELPDDYCFVVGDKEPVKMLVNKRDFYEALARQGVDHPKTYFPETIMDAQLIAQEVEYPVFVRPAISQLFSQAFPAAGKGFIAYSPRDLVAFYELSEKHGIEVMFQEIITGPPTNSYQLEGYYGIDHLPRVLFARQRLRIWPPGFGNTTLCVSIPMRVLDNEKRTINQFIKNISYNGLASAEFKKDDRDGSLKLLEINARPWWHIWLSGACGADILFLSYLDATGEKTEYTEKYEEGVKSTYFTNDLMAAGKMFLNGNLSLREWASSLVGTRKSAFLSKTDPTPFFMQLVTEGSLLAGKIAKKKPS